ncbi:MAG: hypothetical protein K5769_02765 [Pseudobutyrivibrio sp.]|nr:hypothetical protein [Pseudobutyrivibrio sp.]
MTKYEDIYEEKYIDMLCPFDKKVMVAEKLLKIKPKNNSKIQGKNIFVSNNAKKSILTFPVYHCDKCGKNFTIVSKKENQARISLAKKEYINLNPNTNMAHNFNSDEGKVRKIIEGTFFLYDERPNKCLEKLCRSGKQQILKVYVSFKTKDGKNVVREVFQCNKCNLYYLSNCYYSELDFPYAINNEQILEAIEQDEKKRVEKTVKKGNIKNKNNKSKKKKETPEQRKKRIIAEIRQEEIKNKRRKIQQKRREKVAQKKPKTLNSGMEYRSARIPDKIEAKDINVSSINRDRDLRNYQDISPKDTRYQKKRSFFS